MFNPHIFQEGSNESSSTGGLLTVDVLHKRGSAPLFTGGSRLLHRGNPGEIKSVDGLEGGFGRITGNEEKNNGLFDSAFKTVFGLLLPVVLASALGGSATAAADTDVGKQQWSHHEGHHHKHHKKRHHYHHPYGKHSHEEPQQQSGEPNIPHTQAHAQPHESSVSKEGSSTGLRHPKADELANSSSSSSSNGTNNTRSAGGAWLLLCGMAVLVCMGIVAAWRALLIRKLRKKNLGKERDTESLVERPHAQ
ncbi:hypothetical protein, conserved [Eimeria necatrix]|uniref:Transmembrane protein n=1 Tax=Eimeria necatrix TaxID=51315 RepID=U6MQI7_9EIME|nr:hypothetical protein, conserved [Eimeria necatrix]CDJ66276.1 hypothetical protein, conserved [Eimeria necatrix]